MTDSIDDLLAELEELSPKTSESKKSESVEPVAVELEAEDLEVLVGSPEKEEKAEEAPKPPTKRKRRTRKKPVEDVPIAKESDEERVEIKAEEQAKIEAENRKQAVEIAKKAIEVSDPADDIEAIDPIAIEVNNQPDPVEVDVDEVKRDLSISPTDLTASFMDQAPLYVEYARICHTAEYNLDTAKRQLSIVTALVDAEIRENNRSKGFKTTEGEISNRINSDSRIANKQKTVAEARLKANLCKSTLDAFRQRRDMLIQMGADAREEGKGSMRMKGGDEEQRKTDLKKQILENLQKA